MRYPADSNAKAVPSKGVTGASGEVEARCVHRLVESQVARSPHAIAVEFGEERLTYHDLNAKSNQLARYLQGLGIGPDVTVGICLERSVALVVSMLAVLKAGGAYVPLDPSYPAERLQFMLRDSQAPIVITEAGLRGIFGEISQRRIYLHHQWWETSAQDFETSDLESGPGPENLAYLIYTSGSTGKPKGVAMIHRPLSNLIDWQGKHAQLVASTRTLQYTSPSFDVSFQEIFTTWSTGGTLVLIPAALRLDPAELWAFIVRREISRLYLPFAALRQFADAAVRSDATAPQLREIITAGEQLQITPSLRELFARHPKATLHNHYGPSETHVVTACTLGPDPQQWPVIPSIGRAIQHTTIHILDEHLRPMANGASGELFIGGIALARGYFGRPDLTAERFIPDPFDPAPGARLYRTGDLAVRRADGEIDFLGRADQQVKIRGNRVELGEIEAVLAAHPRVAGAAVVARDFRNGDKRLAAYVVWRSAPGLSEEEVCEYLRGQLPEYMVPSDLVSLSAFPLTPSGKVDRKALPAPDRRHLRQTADHSLPETETERKIAELFQQLLQCDNVGLDDDFFRLGGDSILAVELIVEANRHLSSHLDVLTMLQKPTVRALAERVDRQETRAPTPKLVRVRTGIDGAPIFFLNTSLKPYGPLSRIGGREPIFATEVPWLTKDIQAAVAGRMDELPDLATIATRHSELIIKHAPQGPCYLAGFSYGGTVAFEVAHQLAAVGIEVRAVLLFDSNLEFYGWRRRQLWLRRQIRTLWAGGFGRLVYLLRTMRRTVSPTAPAPTTASADIQVSSSADHIAWEKVPWPVLVKIWDRAIGRYRTTPLRSRGVLFRAEECIYEEKHDYDGKLGWDGMFEAGLTVVKVSGSHTSMWEEPHIHALIRQWEAAMETIGRNGADGAHGNPVRVI